MLQNCCRITAGNTEKGVRRAVGLTLPFQTSEAVPDRAQCDVHGDGTLDALVMTALSSAATGADAGAEALIKTHATGSGEQADSNPDHGGWR